MFTPALNKNFTQNDSSYYRFPQTEHRVYPIFEKSFQSSSKCYRLLNLADLFSEFHIVFLLSKPLNQAPCVKSKKAFGYNSTLCFLHVINLLEQLVMNNEDFIPHLLVYPQPSILWTGTVFALNQIPILDRIKEGFLSPASF